MITVANIPIAQNIDFSIVMLFGAFGFIFGYFLKYQNSKKSAKSLSKLNKDKVINTERIESLKERIEALEKKNSELKEGGSKDTTDK